MGTPTDSVITNMISSYNTSLNDTRPRLALWNGQKGDAANVVSRAKRPNECIFMVNPRVYDNNEDDLSPEKKQTGQNSNRRDRISCVGLSVWIEHASHQDVNTRRVVR